MTYKSFVKFIDKQHKSESKTDLKKGEDIFGIGKKKASYQKTTFPKKIKK